MAEYIDRGTAIAKLTALEVIEPNATMVDARRLLADMPAADVAPVVHGWWGKNEFLSDDVNSAAACSLCGKLIGWFGNDFPPYCPYCGAKMDGG